MKNSIRRRKALKRAMRAMCWNCNTKRQDGYNRDDMRFMVRFCKHKRTWRVENMARAVEKAQPQP